jgi:hypothetical protein
VNISPVIPGYLYTVDSVFPEHLLSQINSIDWSARPARRLDIGWGLRRQIDHQTDRDQTVNDYCFTELKTAIEQACGVRFVSPPAQQGFQYWLDLPGFRPAVHTDGDLPSAVQIYLQPADRTDLGTAFYHTVQADSEIHRFDSRPNSGYVMLNQPEQNRPALWHDMTQAVPEGVLRLCLYVTLGHYQRL